VTTPPSVLLEGSFVFALAEPDSEWHAVARDLYPPLLDAFERNEIRLRALSVDIERHPQLRRTLFAPAEVIHVAPQHHRAAARLADAEGITVDTALAVVLMQRERIRRIATFDPWFSTLEDVEVIRRSTTP
jgi:predicted nucleic acid-binding protein